MFHARSFGFALVTSFALVLVSFVSGCRGTRDSCKGGSCSSTSSGGYLSPSATYSPSHSQPGGQRFPSGSGTR